MISELRQAFFISPRNDEAWCELAREPAHTFETSIDRILTSVQLGRVRSRTPLHFYLQ